MAAKSSRPAPRQLLKTLLMSTLLATCGTIALAPAARAQAVESDVQFAVPAGPLGRALVQWGQQAGIQVSYLDAVTAGKTTGGLNARLAPQAALSQLLAGTGLRFTFADARSVVISAAPQGEDSAGLQLGTITIHGGGQLGSADSTYETAGSVDYLSDADIVQQRGTSVGDFIAGVPGVINGDNRNSGALDVNIRGMQGQGRVPVVIDGASQERTVYRGYNGARSGSYVDPDFIAEVAIEKGASAGADASGAVGGIVRMRTIGADDIVLPGASFGVRIRGGFNTNSTDVPDEMTPGGVIGGMFQVGQPSIVRDGGNMDRPSLLAPTGGNGSVALGFKSEYFDLVAAAAHRVNGNYFSGENGRGQARLVDRGDNGYGWNVIGYEGLSPWKGGEEILNTSTENTSYLLKGNLHFGDHSLEVGFNRYDSLFGEIMPTRLGTHTSAVGGFQSALDQLTLDTTTARYRWNPASDMIDLKVDMFRTDMDHRANNLITLWGGGVGNTYSMSRAVRDGITISNESRIAGFAGDFRLQYGGAWQRESIGLPDDMGDDPQEYLNNMDFAPRTGEREELSGFVNATWDITPAVTIGAGLRYADYQTTDQNMRFNIIGFYPNSQNLLVAGTPTTLSGHGLSNHLSLSWSPNDDLQLYARYADTMRMPSVFETVSGFSTAYLPADLRPEQARSIELGVNKTLYSVFGDSDRMRLHFAYYDNNIDDYLTRSNVIYPEPIGFQIGGLGMINLENARMRGFELAADYEFDAFSARLAWNHAITSRFCARPGTLHRQEDLCTEGGFVNSYALQHVPPKDTVSLQLGYRMLDDKLNIGTRISYFSERFTETTVESTSEIQPGRWRPYTLVDVFASYAIDERNQIDFAIDNLTDQYYMDALNAAMMPAPGRTIRVNFTTRF
ncbi:TonB-dependent receptor (plasmid) [Ketogulonicigenium robustum]|uniref:TonB-dependent receptor n=1 Tax=Ketogulonicigenium robustum TaxID=92947 RepID=A0A1W6P354_9RHOB|nr:TonB-dependent receptor [Ketogulonicigenium robustum]ARO15938.1 TonB-dependent receptor [Ketogulonicigenium robustum]